MTQTITQPDTPVAESGTGEAAAPSLSAMFEETEAVAQNTEPAATAEPTEEPATEPTDEVKPEATETAEPKTEETTAPEADEVITMSKAEWNKQQYKLREKARKEREEKERVLKELAELKGEPVQPEAEADPVKEAVLQERAKVSQAAFVRQYGKAALEALCVKDDSPWVQIEEEAKSGDKAAMALWQRAINADDPYEEIRVIVGERDLFQRYETTRIPDLIEKVRAEAKADAERALHEQLNPKKQAQVGSMPHVLSSAQVGGREAGAKSQADDMPALSAIFGE